ncbi:MAG: hypothetical protein O3B13_11395 [Planctomycetota bacterium]|nr:hypothetical protein [Planctomycetota bacterium]
MSNSIFTLLALTAIGVPPDAPPVASFDSPSAAVTVLSFDFEDDEDRDVDGLPDDWNRRRGPGFPGYVRCEIDPEHSHVGDQSLHVKVNGGQVAYFSPFNQELARIEPEFNYFFRGFIRTEHLQHDAAVYTVSFLNSRRQRVQRFVTRPVSGTHASWVPLSLGPLSPHPDVRYVVIGCHVLHGEDQDIRGDVWFDGIWLGKLPRLSLMNRGRDHFLTPHREIVINAKVSGLDSESVFDLHMSLFDVSGKTLAQNSWSLQQESSKTSAAGDRTRIVPWKLPAHEHGCYFVRAFLEREGHRLQASETTLIVSDPALSRPSGEFGWSLSNGLGRLDTKELAFIAHESGIHWLKLPVWSSLYDEGTTGPVELTKFLSELSDRSISVVGLLNDPPKVIRKQFAKQWAGISEVFVLPSAFWQPSLEPVLARYGSTIEYWQLGGDTDSSFVGIKNLEENIRVVKTEFDKIGRNSKIGIQWPWPSSYPVPGEVRNLVSTIGNPEGLSLDEIQQVFDGEKSEVSERWAMLRPAPLELPVADRASTLVRQMVMARLKGSQGIFLSGVVDGERGLLNEDGAPTPMFLPFRTTALSLSGATHLGSFQLPDSPANYVFERDKQVVVVFPGDSPVNAELNLGDNIEHIDMWGRRHTLQALNGKHQVVTDGTPVFCTGCSEAMARWRLETGFESGKLPAEYGGHSDAIVGRNTFPQGVNGTVSLNTPKDWEANPSSWEIELAAGEAFRLPMTIKLPQTASLGAADVVISFSINSDRRRNFDIHRSLEVGLGDLIVDVVTKPLPDGQLLIEQIVTNRTQPKEIMSFRCTLSVSGHKSQTEYVTKLGEEKDRKEYKLPNAQSLFGQDLWLNLEQIGGRRNLNKRLIIGDDWKAKTTTP